jgi:hypothetical protein
MESFDGSRRRVSRNPTERRSPADSEALEQRLERWMSAGRQLVDGVSGSRPGSRPQGRRPEGRGVARGGFDGFGRWVEDRLDWLLDDGDDWREPWQERERPRPEGPAAERPRRALEAVSRRPLQALSRRQPPSGGPPAPSSSPPMAADSDAWPEENSFSVPRWQRPRTPEAPPSPPPSPPPEQGGRPLPRSSRRR